MIIFPGSIKPHVGGPSGYLYALSEGLHEIDASTEIVSGESLTKKTKSFLFTFPFVQQIHKWNRKRLAKRHSPDVVAEDIIKNFKDKYHQPYDETITRQILNPQVKTLHVHNIQDACRLRVTLGRLGIEKDKKILLTTHSPESTAVEVTNTLYNVSEQKKQAVHSLMEDLQREALESADCFVYPSKEAMEPLFQTIPNFDNIIADKPTFFVPTGTIPLQTKLTKQEARKKFGLSDEFVVSFIGRHIAVKGYDILQEAALKLKGTQPKIKFLIAGKTENTNPGLIPPYWTELGYIDPTDLLEASDCFVLPNRRTFYDLVLLEALSTGIPAIVSKTGGNKSILAVCDSLKGFDICGDPVANLVQAILELFELSQDQRLRIAEENQNYYLKNHTPKAFATNYEKTIKEIQDYFFS